MQPLAVTESTFLGSGGGNEFLKAETTEATVGRLIRELDGPCSLTASSYSLLKLFNDLLLLELLIRGFPARTLSRIRSP